MHKAQNQVYLMLDLLTLTFARLFKAYAFNMDNRFTREINILK